MTELTDETHDFFLLALSNFVCETPPLDICEWPDEKANVWIEEHAWQPFEDWSARDIWSEALDLERQFDAVKDKFLANAKITKEFKTVWDALYGFREDCIPEGDPMYDEQWDDICRAMGVIMDACGVKNEEIDK